MYVLSNNDKFSKPFLQSQKITHKEPIKIEEQHFWLFGK
jgi:hypothetical protein